MYDIRLSGTVLLPSCTSLRVSKGDTSKLRVSPLLTLVHATDRNTDLRHYRLSTYFL